MHLFKMYNKIILFSCRNCKDGAGPYGCMLAHTTKTACHVCSTTELARFLEESVKKAELTFYNTFG